MSRESEISDELRQLWTAMFGNPPPLEMSNAELLQNIVSDAAPPPYTVIRRFGVVSPYGFGVKDR